MQNEQQAEWRIDYSLPLQRGGLGQPLIPKSLISGSQKGTDSWGTISLFSWPPVLDQSQDRGLGCDPLCEWPCLGFLSRCACGWVSAMWCDVMWQTWPLLLWDIVADMHFPLGKVMWVGCMLARTWSEVMPKSVVRKCDCVRQKYWWWDWSCSF